ncbi:MAG: nuclear transport factor 2 family protein [Gemmatimonadaceae bacterium]|nr:nuclear transport factor 2 family protein [Gemmatimonadaceae bacterium]
MRHTAIIRHIAATLLVATAAVASRGVAQGTPPGPAPATGQSPAVDTLRQAIVAADSALFDAFNQRDARTLATFFTRDLEFYQDNEGVETFAQTMRDFRQMFAQPAAIRRELVPGTLEVYPIRNYGAMEVGRHRFCHLENGRNECGEFSFVHIWRRTKAGWRIARVVSYGH